MAFDWPKIEHDLGPIAKRYVRPSHVAILWAVSKRTRFVRWTNPYTFDRFVYVPVTVVVPVFQPFRQLPFVFSPIRLDSVVPGHVSHGLIGELHVHLFLAIFFFCSFVIWFLREKEVKIIQNKIYLK